MKIKTLPISKRKMKSVNNLGDITYTIDFDEMGLSVNFEWVIDDGRRMDWCPVIAIVNTGTKYYEVRTIINLQNAFEESDINRACRSMVPKKEAAKMLNEINKTVHEALSLTTPNHSAHDAYYGL